MPPQFISLSEIQKMLVFSPQKTYHLFAQMRTDGKLKEEIDFQVRDRNLLIDITRFFVELEAAGYKNILNDDYKEFHLTSHDITMKSPDITPPSPPEKPPVNTPPREEDMKSPDINALQMILNDYIRNQRKSDDGDRGLRETLDTKDEMILILKEAIDRAEKDKAEMRKEKDEMRKQHDQLRELVSDLSKRNTRLTDLTYHLIARPKKRDEPQENDTTDDGADEPEEATADAENDNVYDAEFAEHAEAHQDEAADAPSPPFSHATPS